MKGPGFDTAFWVSVGFLVALILAAVLADVLPLGEHVDTTKTLTLGATSNPSCSRRTRSARTTWRSTSSAGASSAPG